MEAHKRAGCPTFSKKQIVVSFSGMEPEVQEPEEPEVMEPEVMEPEVTEPEVMQPEVTDPEVMEPEVTEPEVMQPCTPIIENGVGGNAACQELCGEGVEIDFFFVTGRCICLGTCSEDATEPAAAAATEPADNVQCAGDPDRTSATPATEPECQTFCGDAATATFVTGGTPETNECRCFDTCEAIVSELVPLEQRRRRRRSVLNV